MIEIEIAITKKKADSFLRRNIPTAWAEITSGERRLFYFTQTINLEKNNAQVVILKDILNIPKNLFFSLTAEDIVRLGEHIQFMFEKTALLPILDRFEWANRTWYLPKKNFENGSAFEYAMADEFYTEFAKNPNDIQSLILAVIALLREEPKKPNLSREELIERYDLFEQLTIEYAAIVLHYFESVKLQIHEAGKNIGLFEESKEEKENAEGIKLNADDVNFGWWTTYRSIAKLGVFGDFKSVCATTFLDVFQFCIEEKQRMDEQERMMKKNSSI